jgi:hypothetical protein
MPLYVRPLDATFLSALIEAEHQKTPGETSLGKKQYVAV